MGEKFKMNKCCQMMCCCRCCDGGAPADGSKDFRWEKLGTASALDTLAFNATNYEEFMVVVKVGVISGGYHTFNILKDSLTDTPERMILKKTGATDPKHWFAMLMSLSSLKFESVIGSNSVDCTNDLKNTFTLYGR